MAKTLLLISPNCHGLATPAVAPGLAEAGRNDNLRLVSDLINHGLHDLTLFVLV